MRSEQQGQRPAYLGVDLSDRYGKTPRPVWVCGLIIEDGRASAQFWPWLWPAPGEPLDVAPLLPELQAARVVLIAGPQGLARSGQPRRRAEALSRSPGRSPDHLPALGKRYAGLLRSSVELFAALYAAGVRVSPNGLRFGVSETYPATFWAQFKGIPKKTSKAGVAARRGILAALGLDIDGEQALTHGHCDAALAALAAAAADGAMRGMHVVSRGDSVSRGADGLLREGPIVELKLNGWRAEDCKVAFGEALGLEALAPGRGVSRPRDAGPGAQRASAGTDAPRAVVAPSPQAPARAATPKAKPPPAPGPTRTPGVDAAPPASFEALEDDAVRERADELLELLAARARRGRPALVTYRTAWLLLFPAGARDTRSFARPEVRDVLRAAIHTARVPIVDEGGDGESAAGSAAETAIFGDVALDTFVVDSVRGRPGEGHWAGAPYSRQDWIARFGTAELLGPESLRLGRRRK